MSVLATFETNIFNFLGISIVNPQLKLVSVIQKFTWGVVTSSKNLFPAGLIRDPRTGSLVLNSRTGFIQFYDIPTKKLLYNVSLIIFYTIIIFFIVNISHSLKW